MKACDIIVLVVYCCLFLTKANGTQLSKRFNETLTIQCQCEDAPMCNWYHNDQSVPNDWIQANGDLILPANDCSVYGVIIGQCRSENSTNVITNPDMYVINILYIYIFIYYTV